MFCLFAFARTTTTLLVVIVFGTWDAILHYSAETVLCFRNHSIFLPPPPQSISCEQGKPAYGVERPIVPPQSLLVMYGLKVVYLVAGTNDCAQLGPADQPRPRPRPGLLPDQAGDRARDGAWRRLPLQEGTRGIWVRLSGNYELIGTLTKAQQHNYHHPTTYYFSLL